MKRLADNQDALLEKAQVELHQKLKKFLHREWDESTFRQLDEMVHSFAVGKRLQGVDFPQLTAIVLPARRHIRLARRELDHVGIQNHIRSLINLWPDLRAEEIAPAIKRAWPSYDPSVAEEVIEKKQRARALGTKH